MRMPITVKELNERDAGGLWPARKIRCVYMKENLEHLDQQIAVGIFSKFSILIAATGKPFNLQVLFLPNLIPEK